MNLLRERVFVSSIRFTLHTFVPDTIHSLPNEFSRTDCVYRVYYKYVQLRFIGVRTRDSAVSVFGHFSLQKKKKKKEGTKRNDRESNCKRRVMGDEGQ